MKQHAIFHFVKTERIIYKEILCYIISFILSSINKKFKLVCISVGKFSLHNFICELFTDKILYDIFLDYVDKIYLTTCSDIMSINRMREITKSIKKRGHILAFFLRNFNFSF